MAATALAAAVIPGCAASGDEDVPERPTSTVEHALSALPSVERTAFAADGVPYFIKGQLGRVAQRIDDVAGVAGGLGAALPGLVAPFGVRASDLTPTTVQRDSLGMTHVRYAQTKNGLRVVGGDFVVHIAADGVVQSVNGSIRDVAALTALAVVGPEAASEVAARGTLDGRVDIAETELVYVISTATGALHLAWEVLAVGTDVLLYDLVYVDALSAEIVDRHPQVFTAKERHIYDSQNTINYLWFGRPEIGTEARPPMGDAVALAAFDNTGKTYDCYKALYNRDSFNGSGGALRSTVHALFPLPSGGSSANNAAWIGALNINQMAYGDGDGSFMGPTTQGFDVTAHELTHGVTSSTANLAYQNESGALNEGLSDIMAAVCEAWKDGAISADTWLVGEDIFTPATAGDALRYMANPTADSDLYPPALGGSRDFYADRYQGTEDNGGVHLNSGIANLAFHLLAVGGRHPRGRTTFNVPAIGIEKAGAIFQHALTQGYFTTTTNFAQARTLTEQVATQLYPGGATTTAVSAAWAAVGIGSPPAGDLVPPTVSITSPGDGATVAAGFTVEVSASDNVAVTRVELSIDGATAGSDTTAPYSFSTSSNLAAGSHTVTATAFDSANQASSSITVTVSAPSVPDAGVPGTPDAGGGNPGTPDAGGGNPGTPDAGGGNPGTPDAGDGGGNPGGGCSTSSHPGGAAGSMALLLGLAIAMRRRPRR